MSLLLRRSKSIKERQPGERATEQTISCDSTQCTGRNVKRVNDLHAFSSFQCPPNMLRLFPRRTAGPIIAKFQQPGGGKGKPSPPPSPLFPIVRSLNLFSSLGSFFLILCECRPKESLDVAIACVPLASSRGLEEGVHSKKRTATCSRLCHMLSINAIVPYSAFIIVIPQARNRERGPIPILNQESSTAPTGRQDQEINKKPRQPSEYWLLRMRDPIICLELFLRKMAPLLLIVLTLPYIECLWLPKKKFTITFVDVVAVVLAPRWPDRIRKDFKLSAHPLGQRQCCNRKGGKKKIQAMNQH